MSLIVKNSSGQYVFSFRPKILAFSNYYKYLYSGQTLSEWCELFDFNKEQYIDAIIKITEDKDLTEAYIAWLREPDNYGDQL